MTDKTELKRLADRVLNDRRFCGDENHKALADGVLVLIAENERLSSRATVLEKYEDECLRLMREAETERDQLKAEVERLKAENQSEVGACLLSVAENKKLQAENEALRKDAERYRHLRECNSGSLCITKLTIDDGDHVLVEVEADQAIDAASGKGEQS